jgi:hypothetical protein
MSVAGVVFTLHRRGEKGSFCNTRLKLSGVKKCFAVDSTVPSQWGTDLASGAMLESGRPYADPGDFE